MIDLEAIKARRAAATDIEWHICDRSGLPSALADHIFVGAARTDIDALLDHVATLSHQLAVQTQRAEAAEAEAGRLRLLLLRWINDNLRSDEESINGGG